MLLAPPDFKVGGPPPPAPTPMSGFTRNSNFAFLYSFHEYHARRRHKFFRSSVAVCIPEGASRQPFRVRSRQLRPEACFAAKSGELGGKSRKFFCLGSLRPFHFSSPIRQQHLRHLRAMSLLSRKTLLAIHPPHFPGMAPLSSIWSCRGSLCYEITTEEEKRDSQEINLG